MMTSHVMDLLRKRTTILVALFVTTLACAAVESSEWSQPAPGNFPELYVSTDTANSYLIRDGSAAVLIDIGDGAGLSQLPPGVTNIEWVLFTHHHREQCQGAPRLTSKATKFAGPEAERELFQTPAAFRKMDVSLGDAFTIHGASYVRPPVHPIQLDRAFGTNDVFTWRGYSFRCISTPGNSPGALSYVLRKKDRTYVFSGDVILRGAKMHTWFDTEWDYGFAAGIRALRASAEQLIALKPTQLLPSHGEPIRQAHEELRAFTNKLSRLEKLYVRGYGVEHASVAYQDKVSTPTTVSNVWQVSPHVFKFKRPNFWPNFALILAESGRALVVDCGLLDESFLDGSLEGLRKHYGLKAIDAVIVTHMHGDHFLEAPYLREKWGAQVWALENMVDKMEHPEWFDYAAPIQAYRKKQADGSLLKGLKVDRAFKPGEKFSWEGHEFTVDWMPGQTEFALCLHGRIDGKLMAFTGDNIFGDPDDPTQTGHEAMVAHNSAILEEGYIYAGEYLKGLKPDIMVGGHSFVMGRPAEFIERYRKWAYEMRDAFRDLSSTEDYRYWFDPFWVRAEPYRSSIRKGTSGEVQIKLRNFAKEPTQFGVNVVCPPHVAAQPGQLQIRVPGESVRTVPIRLSVNISADPGLNIIGLDISRGEEHIGQLFDLVLEVKE